MSKFVTYGVTEMLDNDQKFIIDSDRTGPGSITAKDAASSLLSKWAGFETFEEAVQNTIEHNQEFIDRDTAIRSETAELKKKIVTTFPAKEASGAVATFESEFEDAPLKSCIVQIEPVQEGSGDPSPDNVRPISGWTGCEVQRTGKNLLPFPYKAGSRAEDGITWTSNEDGTVTVNSTSSSNKYYWLYGSSKTPVPSWAKALAGKTVTVSAGNGSFVEQGYASMQMIFYGTPSLVIHERTATIPSDLSSYTGFGCVLFVSGGNTVNATVMPQIELGSTPTAYVPYTGQTYPITFPTEAGTVYGGYVDVTGGELVVDRAEVADLGTLSWSYRPTSNPPRFFASLPYSGKNDPWWVKDAMISTGEYTLGTNIGQNSADKKYGISTKIIYFTNAEYTNVNDFKASITGTQVVYRLATPIHYPITPNQIKTLLGTNNIWANTGDTAVEYLMSDVSWYVEKKLKAFQSVLAGVEDSVVASKNYSTNSYLIFNDDIYRVTKTITAGETIEEGVNVTKTTVAEQLMALAQA